MYPIPRLHPYTIRLSNGLLELREPMIMGILNATPDSFYSGSRMQTVSAVQQRALQIQAQGGAFIDIGACSTRPGTTLPDEQEEADRLRMALKAVRQVCPDAVISVDTFRSAIAKMSVEEYGAQIINDISGGLADKDMFRTVAQLQVPYVLMHLHPSVELMHQIPVYSDGVVSAVRRFFQEQVEKLRTAGVHDIILDPGYGFSKSLDDHYRLLYGQDLCTQGLDLPLLVGISRKRMVQKVAEVPSAAEAMNGSTVLHSYFLFCRPAHIIRTHDVEACHQAIKIYRKLCAVEDELSAPNRIDLYTR